MRRRLSAERVLFDFDFDLRRVEQRVVDEAVMDGAFDSGAVLVRQLEWSFDLDAEIVYPGDRVFNFVGDDPDTRAFGG